MERTIETENDTFQFDPVNNPDHFHLLSLVTLDPSKLENPAWVKVVAESACIGSTEITTSFSFKQASKVWSERGFFDKETGLDDSRHPLAAVVRNGDQKRIERPYTLLEKVAVLEELTGDSIGSLRSTNSLLTASIPHLYENDRLIERLAYAFHWEGDTQALVRANPDLLRMPKNTLMLLGRLAQRCATEDFRKMSAEEIAGIAKKPVEWHMLALLQHRPYVFGKTGTWAEMQATPLPQSRERIMRYLSDWLVARRVGPRVVRSYIRACPPDHPEDLPKFLKRYLPVELRPHREEMPTYVTGKERWLADVKLPVNAENRRMWLSKLNKAIHIGSQPANPESRDYQSIVDARRTAFELFGWAKPRHPQHQNYVCFAGRYTQLASPDRIISICNILAKHKVVFGVKAIGDCFMMLRHSPEKVESDIHWLESEGFILPWLLAKSPGVLGGSKTKIQRTIDRNKIRADAS